MIPYAIADPTIPPKIASLPNALLKISANTAGILVILTPSTIKVTPRYRRHMIGTIFDVNRIILFKPPEMIIAAIITMITPTIQCGTPKALYIASAMEFGCVVCKMPQFKRLQNANTVPNHPRPSPFFTKNEVPPRYIPSTFSLYT